MELTFHFRSAVVSEGRGFTRVRFWARTIDTMQLELGERGKEKFLPDADIILLVEGNDGNPDFTLLDEGPQTFEGPGIEVLFRGACVVDSSHDGLIVKVPDGKLTVLRGKGLPFPEEILLETKQFDFLGPISIEHDAPPHRLPPGGNRLRLRS